MASKKQPAPDDGTRIDGGVDVTEHGQHIGDNVVGNKIVQFIFSGKGLLWVGLPVAVTALIIAGAWFFLRPSPALRLDPDELSLAYNTINNQAMLRAVGDSSEMDPGNVTWASSDTAVATVENGRVTVHRPGRAEITAEAVIGGQRATGAATVDATTADVAALVVQRATEAPLSVGDAITLRAVAQDADGYRITEGDPAITWSTSEPAVTTVSAQGMVMARGGGAAWITARSAGGHQDSVRIAVQSDELPEPESEPPIRPSDAVAADVTLDFALSPAASGYETRSNGWEEGLVYFEVSSGRHPGCNTCEDVNAPECDDCWWALCERQIQDPVTLDAIQTYVGRDSPRFSHVASSADLLRTWENQDKDGVFQSLLPHNREEWEGIQEREDRRALENLAANCSGVPPQLTFSFELENRSEETVRARSVKYHILVDGGEAGGGTSFSGPLFPSATYVHVIERDCQTQNHQGYEVYERPLETGNSRVFRIAPGPDNAFDLLLNVKTYDGAFMARHKVRIDLITDQGTVSTDAFWVDLFSCAG